MSGDCFMVAGQAVLMDRSLTLVHGIPLGQAGLAEGLRYWHAWVESTVTVDHPELARPITTTWVIDRSNGQNIKESAAFYYKLGDVEQTWRYTADEAHDLIEATGHWGPWVAVEGVA